MQHIGILLIGLLVALGATPSQASDTPPEPITIEEMDVLLNQADDAYKAGNYAQAYRLFRHELAARGNAYAQHTAGFMLYNGQGVQADPVTGVAWMALAADQGNLTLVRAAKKARKSLSDEQQRGMQTAYEQLKTAFGDCALLAARITQLERSFEAQTGSRIPENFNRITVMYQFGMDLSYQQTQMKLREMLKIQRKAYRNECR